MSARALPLARRTRGADAGFAAAMLACILVALALRLHLLGEQSVWWDEGLAAWAARQDLLSIARWTSADVHPPLYFWLLHAWRLLAGETAFALRLLSVFAGVLLIPLSGALGRLLGGARAGMLAAGLVAVEPFLVWWSQEMRMYQLGALLATLSLLLTLLLTSERAHSRRRVALWLAYIAATAAALYTLYLAVIVVILEAVYVVLWAITTPGRRRDLLSWAAAMGMALALVAPWVIYAAARMRTWSSAAPWSGEQFARVYVSLLATGISTNVDSYLLPSLAFVVVAVICIGGLLTRRWRSHWPQIVLLVACLLILPVAVFALTLSRGLFYSPNVEARYLLLFAPAVYVLLAWGMSTMGRRWLLACAAVVAALAAGGLATHYGQRYLEDDYQTIVSTLRAYAQPGDAIILHSDSDWPVFAYHYGGEWTGIPYGEMTTAAGAAARLGPVVSEHGAVWLVVTPDAPRIDRPGYVEAYLQNMLPRRAENVIGDKRLVLFAGAGVERPARTPASGAGLELTISPDVTLLSFEQALQRVRPGDRLHSAVSWRGVGCAATLPLSLVRRGRDVIATLDRPLCDRAGAGDVHRALLSIAVAADWPAGAYELRTGQVVLSRLAILPGMPAGRAALPPSARPLNVDFDGKVRLRGYSIEPSGSNARRAGDSVYVTLYWVVQQPIEQSYTVFVHLLGAAYNARQGNLLWGQHDGIPAAGASPTSSWRVGTLVEDVHIVTIDAQAPVGEYQVEVGLYDAVSPPYPRLSVRDAQGAPVDDRVIIETLRIER